MTEPSPAQDEVTRLRAIIIQIEVQAESNRVWGGTSGYIYYGLNRGRQEKILQLCREALGDD